MQFSMPRASRYLWLHLALKVAMRLSSLESCANTISMGGRARGGSLPITPTYSSRPAMNSSTMAAVLWRVWMKSTRSARA